MDANIGISDAGEQGFAVREQHPAVKRFFARLGEETISILDCIQLLCTEYGCSKPGAISIMATIIESEPFDYFDIFTAHPVSQRKTQVPRNELVLRLEHEGELSLSEFMPPSQDENDPPF